MRQGLTIVPAGILLVASMLAIGAGPETSGAGASPFDERFGHPIAPIFLLLRDDIQKDLKLNAQQVAGARAMVGQLIERGFQVKGKTGPEAEAMRREIDETMKEWLRQNLNQSQHDRLFQIGIQWEGASALGHPSVADHLQLLPMQRDRIDRILKERDRRQLTGRLGPSEFDRFSREAIAVLHPLQKQQWDLLLGPPCRFAIRRPASPSSHPAPEAPPAG